MITPLNIRPAEASDRRSIARLAQLDEAPTPIGDMLVAEAGEEVVAALPLAGGRPLADPFRRTADAVELLALRARQVRHP